MSYFNRISVISGYGANDTERLLPQAPVYHPKSLCLGLDSHSGLLDQKPGLSYWFSFSLRVDLIKKDGKDRTVVELFHLIILTV